MEMILPIITIVIIVFILWAIFSKNDGKADLKEANRRRNHIISLSESEIIKFAKEKSVKELSQWINYKDLLEGSNQLKYFTKSGFEDNEIYWWYEIVRKSDRKCIYSETEGIPPN